MTPTSHTILAELFRTLDDAILAEQGAGTDRNNDRLLTYGDLYHATCRNPHTCWQHNVHCTSPYRELLRLTRRPGPLHAHNNTLRWNVMARYRWCDRRPLEVLIRNGRYILAPNQAVPGDDGQKKRGTRPNDKAVVVVETWSPRVDQHAVTAALDWLADNYTVPLQLPGELRHTIAA